MNKAHKDFLLHLNIFAKAVRGRREALKAYKAWHDEYRAMDKSKMSSDDIKRQHHKEAGLRTNLSAFEMEIIKEADEIVGTTGDNLKDIEDEQLKSEIDAYEDRVARVDRLMKATNRHTEDGA